MYTEEDLNRDIEQAKREIETGLDPVLMNSPLDLEVFAIAMHEIADEWAVDDE